MWCPDCLIITVIFCVLSDVHFLCYVSITAIFHPLSPYYSVHVLSHFQSLWNFQPATEKENMSVTVMNTHSGLCDCLSFFTPVLINSCPVKTGLHCLHEHMSMPLVASAPEGHGDISVIPDFYSISVWMVTWEDFIASNNCMLKIVLKEDNVFCNVMGHCSRACL